MPCASGVRLFMILEGTECTFPMLFVAFQAMVGNRVGFQYVGSSYCIAEPRSADFFDEEYEPSLPVGLVIPLSGMTV